MKTAYSKSEWAKEGFQNFIASEEITAPYTTIVNRAKVKSPSIKGLLGVERIHFYGISVLADEFGPAGQAAYEIRSKDSRVRFYGAIYAESLCDATGVRPLTNVGGYVEVVFYGTGLNIVGTVDASARDIRASIDGGAETANLTVTASVVLNSRNYNPNQIINAVSGLSLGWHTVLIRDVTTTFNWFGVEILNEHSQLKCSVGSAFSGMSKETLSLISSTNYNEGITGTKGARVVKYLKDGVIGQVVTECATSPSYLTNANHVNEEVVRRVHHKEFGANRADDFSTINGTPTDRAFTLDDGTTTLVADNVLYAVNEGMGLSPSGFFTLTFVGTGLDYVGETGNAGSYGSIYVDGVLVGNDAINRGIVYNKVCSGLPYGTHTVKFYMASGSMAGVNEFVIYQPKKPTLPEGAIEIADYNVMANYIANTTSGLNTIAIGVLRKQSIREYIHSGTGWGFQGLVPSGWINGFDLETTVNNDYVEYTFFGSGFELRFPTPGATSSTNTVSINGSTNLSAYTTAVYGTGVSFVSSTGVITTGITGGVGCGLKVVGLTLGMHKVRVTFSGGSTKAIDCFDIITPIHINHSSFKVGSLSLISNPNTQPIAKEVNGVDLSKAKAWMKFDGTNSKILSSNNIAAVIKKAVGDYQVCFEKQFKNSNYIITGLVMDNQRILCTNPDATLMTPNRCDIRIYVSGALADAIFTVAFFGELADEENV